MVASAAGMELEAIVQLLAVLEATPTKCVRLTTLSKVLRRKRPGLLPLFDDNIGYCYSECTGAPVPYENGRSRTGYRRAWLSALQEDLAARLPYWKRIASMAPGPKITPIRALGIIGWDLGNRRN